jgi:aspartate dehydrogenase
LRVIDKRIKIGLIGCGTIGSEIARACQGKLSPKMVLSAVCDTDAAKATALAKTLEKAKVLDMDGLIGAVDLVVEAASAAVSGDVVKRCVKNKRDVFVMSVGGMLGKNALLKEAEARGVKVYFPSGAICGIDGLKSASAGEIYSVTLTTRKPPRGLKGAPYLKDKNMDLENIAGEVTVFEGSAEEAIKGFPQNVNVAAVLSLAGIGARKTRVRIVTSRDYVKNVHEVEVEGEFGKLTTRTENVPSRTNPKTSAMAFFSAIATLDEIASYVRVGT